MNQNTIVIRPAALIDAALIFDLIMELALYEKAPEQVLATQADLERTLFGEQARAHAVICELEGKVVGYAVYFFNYSTWLGRNGIYLEDVYVRPSARGQGCGKALLKYIAQIAVRENCGRFEWSVLDWNTPAIEFYEALGARAQSEWTIYRLTGDSLRQLAQDTMREEPTP
jgi:GNAT superfamily N-acetyltransferase